MKISQIANTLNTVILKEVTGVEVTVAEDLSNIVDVGTTILNYFDANGDLTDACDNFMKSIIDQIGKIMFEDRPYTSQAPNILKNGWEYGSILEKVRCEVPDARDNDTWALPAHASANPATYPDPFELSIPNAKAQFFNSKVTYEVPITLATIQLKEAFKSASEMSRFFAMIENRIRMKRILCNDALIMGTIRNLIGEKIANGTNVVNLVTEYNTAMGLTGASALTADKALVTKEFLRFAAKVLSMYKKYLSAASVLYNDGNYVTFTPADRLKFVVNTQFAKALGTYLYSDTYHDEFVSLAGYEEVAYWQSFKNDAERLKLNVVVDKVTRSDTSHPLAESRTDTVALCNNLLAVMFDNEAAAVCNENDRVTSIYNPRGEYTNYFYKWDAMYMNDTMENCVVFTLTDPVSYTYNDDYEYVGLVSASGTLASSNASVTAPVTTAKWNSDYAKANSDYWIEDSSTTTGDYPGFKKLTTTDKTTETGWDSANYNGKIIVKKKS